MVFAKPHLIRVSELNRSGDVIACHHVNISACMHGVASVSRTSRTIAKMERLGACVLAPLSHCPPAPFSTSSQRHFVLRAGCSLPRPRQARTALPARLEPMFRRVTKRTRSLLDLSRLLQRKKQKAHQVAAAWSKLTRFSIMIMQPLRIGLTLSTPASLPLCSIGKSAKAVFAFLSPTPRATTVPFHSVMPLAGERASAPPSLHSTIVAIADRDGSVIHKQVAQQVRNSRRALQLSDFYVRGSASKSFFTGAIYLVGLSPSSLLSCFLQLEKARSPPAVKKSVGAALIASAMRTSGFLSPDGSGQG